MENRLWQNRFEINSRSSQAFQHGGNRARRSTPKEEQILQKAQCYLLFEAKRPMLWTVPGIREEKGLQL